ncbi:hypothetical protein [Pelagibaculum spongiae]|nr:hypothetical protein [Pelagibaculum spongiae]
MKSRLRCSVTRLHKKIQQQRKRSSWQHCKACHQQHPQKKSPEIPCLDGD